MTSRVLPLALLLVLLPACDFLVGGDAECSSDDDCSGDDICDGGECVECENNRDCDATEECNDGDCERIGDEGEGEGTEGEGEGTEGEGEGTEGEGEVGAPCDPETFESTCSGDVITLCGPENTGDPDTVLTFNCSTEFYTDGTNPITIESISCVVPDTSGTPPPSFEAQCWGEAVGAQCQGVIGIMAGGADALIIGCGPGLSCTVDAAGETCAAAPSNCTTTGTSCDGNLLTFCAFGDDNFTLTDPFIADCTLLGGVCRTEGEFSGCFSPAGGLCSEGGFLAACDAGLTCTPESPPTGLGTCN